METKNLQRTTQQQSPEKGQNHLWYAVPILLLAGMLVILYYNYQDAFTYENFKEGFDRNFLIYLCIGVFAQLVDGTLGMGYGATCTSFLLAFGVSTAVSSMGVHVAEMFTTGASAMSN